MSQVEIIEELTRILSSITVEMRSLPVGECCRCSYDLLNPIANSLSLLIKSIREEDEGPST